MEETTPTKGPVRIPFRCPVCVAENAIELVVLSRAGGMECHACGKFLRSADVMRAIHSPRERTSAPMRTRAPPKPKPQLVWPPTPASRAAIAPLRTRNGKEERR